MPKPKPATTGTKRTNAPDNKTFSRMLIDEPPMMFSPTLARLVGDREAIVVQQVHYWLTLFRQDPGKYRASHFWDGRWWVWNSYPEWQRTNFTFWSEDTVIRCFRGAERKGILLSCTHSPDPRDRTKSYSIDYDRLDALLEASENGDGGASLSGEMAPDEPDQPEPPVMETAFVAECITAICGDGRPQNAVIHDRKMPSSLLIDSLSETSSENTAAPFVPAEQTQDTAEHSDAPNPDDLWDAISSASEEERQEKPPKGRSKDAIERALHWVCNPTRDRDIEASLYGQVLAYGKLIRQHGTVTAEQILEQFGPGGPFYQTILAGDDPTKPRLPSPAVVSNWAFRLDNVKRTAPKPKFGDPPALPSDDEMRRAAEAARAKRQALGQRPVLGMLDDLLGPVAGTA